MTRSEGPGDLDRTVREGQKCRIGGGAVGDAPSSVVLPCTVKLLGFNSRIDAGDVPLSIVIVRMSVVAPEPPNVALEAPVKVMPAPAVLVLVLKSRVPLLVRLPPTESRWVVTAPEAPVRKVPPLAIVNAAARGQGASGRGFVLEDSGSSLANLQIIADRRDIYRDLSPSAIVTFSSEAGTTPPSRSRGAPVPALGAGDLSGQVGRLAAEEVVGWSAGLVVGRNPKVVGRARSQAGLGERVPVPGSRVVVEATDPIFE